MMKLQGFIKSFFIVLSVILVLCFHSIDAKNEKCHGTAEVDAVYDHKPFPSRFVRLVILATVEELSTSDYSVTVSASTASSAAELQPSRNDEHGVILFYGLNTVERLNFGNEVEEPIWKSIEIRCQPAGVVHRSPYEIVGYCKLNTTQVPPCVQYFRLKLSRDGEWTDDTSAGLCSYALSTTNLTNSVIVQFDGPYGYVQILYFGERRTNKFHELKMGAQEVNRYTVPDYHGLVMMIDRIVLVSNGTFNGVRIEATSDNTPTVIYHRFFSSSEQRFVGPITITSTAAFDSNDLNYIVSFTSNYDKIVISENDISTQYKLVSIIDDPIQCHNMAGPDHHYIVCLTGDGFSLIMINVTSGTSQIILHSDSLIYNFGLLDEMSFYLLNMQQELSFYQIGKSSALHVGSYTIPPDANFRLIGYKHGNLTCSDHTQDINNFNNYNQTDMNNQTNNYHQSYFNNQSNSFNMNNPNEVNNQSNVNNQSDINNQINKKNQGNHKQSNGHVVAICICVILAILGCAAISVYGLKGKLSLKQKFEIQYKESIFPLPKSLSIGSIESAVPISENSSDTIQGESLPGNVVSHNSPPCHRPQKETAPLGYGTMFIRTSMESLPEVITRGKS